MKAPFQGMTMRVTPRLIGAANKGVQSNEWLYKLTAYYNTRHKGYCNLATRIQKFIIALHDHYNEMRREQLLFRNPFSTRAQSVTIPTRVCFTYPDAETQMSAILRLRVKEPREIDTTANNALFDVKKNVFGVENAFLDADQIFLDVENDLLTSKNALLASKNAFSMQK